MEALAFRACSRSLKDIQEASTQEDMEHYCCVHYRYFGRSSNAESPMLHAAAADVGVDHLDAAALHAVTIRNTEKDGVHDAYIPVAWGH